jgi:hypothetical protein
MTNEVAALSRSFYQQYYQYYSNYHQEEGWIGHPLDPIGCLFDTLAEASLAPEDVARASCFAPGGGGDASGCVGGGLDEEENSPPLRYRHVVVSPGGDPLPCSSSCPSGGNYESYLTLCMEVALMGLGQQRGMPAGLYAQEKACKQEDRLIRRLEEMELDDRLVEVLRRQAAALLDAGPTSGLGQLVPPDSTPMHTFARYLFTTLINYDVDLAYRAGLRAMRFVSRSSLLNLFVFLLRWVLTGL